MEGLQGVLVMIEGGEECIALWVERKGIYDWEPLDGYLIAK